VRRLHPVGVTELSLGDPRPATTPGCGTWSSSRSVAKSTLPCTRSKASMDATAIGASWGNIRTSRREQPRLLVCGQHSLIVTTGDQPSHDCQVAERIVGGKRSRDGPTSPATELTNAQRMSGKHIGADPTHAEHGQRLTRCQACALREQYHHTVDGRRPPVRWRHRRPLGEVLSVGIRCVLSVADLSLNVHPCEGQQGTWKSRAGGVPASREASNRAGPWLGHSRSW